MLLSVGRGSGVMFTVTADIMLQIHKKNVVLEKNVWYEICDSRILPQFLFYSNFAGQHCTLHPYSGLLGPSKVPDSVKLVMLWNFQGSGSGLDPYSIGPVDPDPYSESGSGSRRAKMTHKSRKKFVKVHVLKCWMASFESWRLLLQLGHTLWRPRNR